MAFQNIYDMFLQSGQVVRHHIYRFLVLRQKGPCGREKIVGKGILGRVEEKLNPNQLIGFVFYLEPPLVARSWIFWRIFQLGGYFIRGFVSLASVSMFHRIPGQAWCPEKKGILCTPEGHF